MVSGRQLWITLTSYLSDADVPLALDLEEPLLGSSVGGDVVEARSVAAIQVADCCRRESYIKSNLCYNQILSQYRAKDYSYNERDIGHTPPRGFNADWWR